MLNGTYWQLSYNVLLWKIYGLINTARNWYCYFEKYELISLWTASPRFSRVFRVPIRKRLFLFILLSMLLCQSLDFLYFDPWFLALICASTGDQDLHRTMAGSLFSRINNWIYMTWIISWEVIISNESHYEFLANIQLLDTWYYLLFHLGFDF